MTNGELIVNDAEKIDHSPHMPAVHPVLEVVFGTTMAELLLVQHAQLAGLPHLVPWRGLLVDSLPYEDLVARLVQNGWTRKQVEEAIPRSHYFHLTSPFSADFDFDNPLNRAWLATIFEPSLQRLAAQPNAPGCAGTPALGRARVEGNEQDLGMFFQAHLQQLTQVRTETLALLPGVLVFIITTYRGGTGTGAATTGGAVLRSVMGGGEIHLHTIMPCVYLGDDHAYANAFGTLSENQWYHRYGGGVPMKGDQLLKAPFESATYTFASNGAVALGHVDALMQEAAILRAYLRAPTQAAINARRVDLVDVTPYDLQDNPMHVRVETALSIRTMHPGTQEYMVTEWVRQEIEEVRERFEAWCQSGMLTTDEEQRVKEVVEQMIKDLNLYRGALLARLDPSPAPTNVLRSFFEQATGMIGSMRAQAIKQNMAGLPSQVRDAFLKFEGSWEDRARQVAVALPREVMDYVMSKMAASPHLALTVLERDRDHLASLAKEATKEAEQEKHKRDAASKDLGPALNAVQEARGILGFINADEVTRDAAHNACNIALAAAHARAQQQRIEYFVKTLEGGMSSLDSRGKPVTIPAVTAVLRDRQVEQMAAIRRRQAGLVEALRLRLEDLGQQIEKRSQVFQRSLLYDGMSRAKLDEKVRAIRARVPDAPPIAKFLEGQQDLQQTLAALLPLLPSYAESGKSLVELLANEAGKRNLVVQLLRSLKPFTPIDRVVEDQQGLRNRRDTLVVLELPGGQDGPLAELMLHEKIVTNPDQIVASGEDEIRLYVLRDGLPYAAILPLQSYKGRYDRYLAKPGAITPHTVPNTHQLPGMEPSRTNLRLHTEMVLYTAKATLPHRVAPRPSGGFVLRYEQDTGHGMTTLQEEPFPDFSSMEGWVAKRVELRKALQAELQRHLDDDPEAYKGALVSAWQQAASTEREHLQEVLFSLKVDPARTLVSKSVKQAPIPNAQAASRRRVGARRK